MARPKADVAADYSKVMAQMGECYLSIERNKALLNRLVKEREDLVKEYEGVAATAATTEGEKDAD